MYCFCLQYTNVLLLLAAHWVFPGSHKPNVMLQVHFPGIHQAVTPLPYTHQAWCREMHLTHTKSTHQSHFIQAFLPKMQPHSLLWQDTGLQELH